MCGLIWLPRPSDEAALRRELQVVGDRRQVIGVRAKAIAMPVRQLEALGALGREQQREERVVARLRGADAVVAVGLGRARDVLDLEGRRVH